MEFSRQKYWSGLPFPSPGDLPDPGIEPGSSTLRADTLCVWTTRESLLGFPVLNHNSLQTFWHQGSVSWKMAGVGGGWRQGRVSVSPSTHLLLWGLVPNRPWTNACMWPGWQLGWTWYFRLILGFSLSTSHTLLYCVMELNIADASLKVTDSSLFIPLKIHCLYLLCSIT